MMRVTSALRAFDCGASRVSIALYIAISASPPPSRQPEPSSAGHRKIRLPPPNAARKGAGMETLPFASIALS